MAMTIAHFPFVRTLEGFESEAQVLDRSDLAPGSGNLSLGHKPRLDAGAKPLGGNGSIRNSSSTESAPASAGGEPCLSLPVRFAVALPARWL